ncbi:TetR/AcrR family transcriptional regulator [Halobacillus shinanisalinarum]|uniref:TetR/AcrR family transcriptional regulator n=1 Tax=Halobacillus shinanisalinarum TaxID=2932258 RepID=A0ABY4GXU9_9BACI|nr:TetR/AcrR family transcriptional regulator [Halobacillus shinanisalinarum]UOQ92899.1 TetR/AcrR family transcriptional regulator [Halobacillus shinanisalinarum]
MSAGRKEIQRARMWRYFLDAATDVIENEGIDNVTIRKIADKAGYTSSTAYNYFQDLSHLKFFAAMRFTKDYIEDLPHYMEKGNNTVEKWLYAWECFCKYSFEQPQIYSVIFINNLGSIPEDLLENYYKVYQNDLIGLPEQIQSIVMEHTLSTRSALYIQDAVEEGFIEQKDIEFIADTTLLLWKGMMTTVMNQRRNYSVDEAIDRTLDYIYESVMRVVSPEKRKEIAFHPVRNNRS